MTDAGLTRREMITAAGAAALLPALPAVSVAAGRPAPSSASATPFAATLLLGSSNAGQGNHRWAPIAAGEITGGPLQGRVESGRLDWHVDPASGAVAATATCRIRRPDGTLVEQRCGDLGASRVENGLISVRAMPGAGQQAREV
ncbi:MAG: hypothetical protein ABW278_01745 [Steroidobacteraceae bacterium]